MLNLRDEHLQQALKHAPDSELAPSEIVRKKVLDYADKALASRSESWFARLKNMFNGWKIPIWQWAGMSSVAVALLAVIMLREQLPQEPVWRDSDAKDIAQNTAPAPEKALNEERVDATELSAATAAAEAPTSAARTQDQDKAETPTLADEGNVVIAAAPTAAAPAAQSAPAEQALAKQDNGADAELRGRMESAPANDAVASAEQKSEAEKPEAAARKSVGLVDAGALGVAKANRDIQAGVLRILVAEWPADKAQLDEATGYRVEVVTDLVPEELETYNQTMRDWHQQQQ